MFLFMNQKSFHSMVHFFTPDEANKELPRARKLVSSIVDLKKQLDQSSGRNRAEILDSISVANGKLAEAGIELKDLDIGLVDFPAKRFDEPVYLCWKLGEAEVLYWHGVNEGYRGRKLLKPEATQVR